MFSSAAPLMLLAAASPRRPYLAVCAPAAQPNIAEVSAAEPSTAEPSGPISEVAASPVRMPPRGAVSADQARAELINMLPALRRRAWRWCRDRAEAEDLVQETLMRALGMAPRFDSENHLRAWLYTVLRNLFISRRRRNQSAQRALGELSGAVTSMASAPPPAQFLTRSVERALQSLPEAFACVIRLVDLEEHSYADAASLLGIPVGTVMSRLFRGRQRLAQQLCDHE